MLGQHSFLRFAVRTGASAVMAAGLLLGAAPSAHAGAQLLCNGGGGVAIDKQLDGTYKWVLSGVATCNNPQGDPVRQAALTGLTTTPGLGFCSDEATISAFSMNVAVTFTSFSPTRGLVTTIQHQVWSLPETTFPVVTGFSIRDEAGPALGLGEISTHVAGKCPPAGEPSMQVAWVQAA